MPTNPEKSKESETQEKPMPTNPEKSKESETQEKPMPTSTNSFWSNLFGGEDQKNLKAALRTLVYSAALLLFIVVLVAIILCEYAIIRIVPKLDLRERAVGSEWRDYTVHLDASARWVNTGILVPAGATVGFEVEGRVHLAVHHLIDAARSDEKPTFPWISAEGKAFDMRRDKDKYRKSLLINTGANMGTVIASLHDPNDPQDSAPDIVHNPRPKNMIILGADRMITNPGKASYLYLVVNEMVLNSLDQVESEKVYKESQRNDDTPISEAEVSERWKHIQSEGYWDLWFDDNIGTFVVKVKIHP